jgi:hypothetical protein
MRIAPLALTLALAADALLAGCGGSGSTAPVPTAPSPFQFVQPAGVFYKDYTGPQRPAIDAVAAGGKLVAASQTIVLDAQMAGPVAAGAPNYYVWGFDRGGAANAPFPDEPAVSFNAVVVVTVGATGTPSGVVNLLNGSPAQPVTATLTALDTIEVTIPVALLPSTGLAASAYRWNLWPRSAVGGAAAAQIASFIPENALAPLVAR